MHVNLFTALNFLFSDVIKHPFMTKEGTLDYSKEHKVRQPCIFCFIITVHQLDIISTSLVI